MTAQDPWYIWTDFGGVLTPPIAGAMADFCQTHGLDPDDLRRAMGQLAKTYGVADPLELLDRPMISEADWIAGLNAELGGTLALSTLAEAWFDGRATNTAWVEALTDLRSDTVRVGMLSNMVPTWDSHWRKMVDAEALFEHVVLSFEEGSRKPEASFFVAAATQADVRPDRCILVDDLEKNCAGAKAQGWQAVQFRDAASAKAEVLAIMQPSPVQQTQTHSHLQTHPHH